jgi:hypothetical protein
MKFQVTYRLTHPEYLPSIAHITFSARTHQQLDKELARLVRKWAEQGYTLQVMAIRKWSARPSQSIHDTR